jgi:hypothetical protein
MDPNQINQINQMNNLNQINQMSLYQNYLLNNENKVDPHANMNLLYNYQQYYKGLARTNTNTGGVGLNVNQTIINPIQMQNAYLQSATNAALQSNALNSANLYNTINNNFETQNLNENQDNEGDEKSYTENSAHSEEINLENQNLYGGHENQSDKLGHSQNQQNKNENEIDRPWDRVSKDPSIIQKGTELFVGNLSLDTTEHDLYEAFKDCGEVIDVRLNIYISINSH